MVKAGSSGASLLTRAQGHILRQHKPPLLWCLSVVSIVLATPLNQQANVGQLIQGRVSGNVVHKGTMIIPDGAVVTGRVRGLERHSLPADYFVVALEFSE